MNRRPHNRIEEAKRELIRAGLAAGLDQLTIAVAAEVSKPTVYRIGQEMKLEEMTRK